MGGLGGWGLRGWDVVIYVISKTLININEINVIHQKRKMKKHPGAENSLDNKTSIPLLGIKALLEFSA